MEHRRVPPTMISVNGVGTPSVMASPASSVGTPKMNGSLHQSQRHQTLNNGSKFGHSSNTPIPRQGLDVSSRETFSHSLHDTSQELSRSVLSTGPRLRTPNPIPTPIPLLASGQNFNPSVSSGVSPVPPPHTNPSVPVHSDAALMHDSSPLSSVSLQESLASLALLCVVSVLLAFLAVLFLMKVMPMSIVDGRPGPGPGLCNISALTSHIVDIGEYRLVYEVVIGLATCTISLDFTCLLICCAQFIFASKLAKTSYGRDRAVHYLCQSSYSRVVAVGAFFVSIPVLLTAIILYAFIQFETKSAIITSLLLGLSIIFCGLAMIHNVYVWQQEKTKATVERIRIAQDHKVTSIHSEHSSNQGLDMTQNASMELSTLV